MAISRGDSAHISFKWFNLASSIFCDRIRWFVPDRRSRNDISSSAASDIAARISGVMKLLTMASTSGLTPPPASDPCSWSVRSPPPGSCPCPSSPRSNSYSFYDHLRIVPNFIVFRRHRLQPCVCGETVDEECAINALKVTLISDYRTSASASAADRCCVSYFRFESLSELLQTENVNI